MEEQNVKAIAIAQEDTELEAFAKMPGRLGDRLPILADLNRAQTPFLDRTTAYLIDKEGIVRQIFPMIIHARPSWDVVIAEMARISGTPSETD